MTAEDFKTLLQRFCGAAEAGNGTEFAACFTADGVYRDYIYGDHAGRDSVAHMLTNLFHRDAGPDYRWQMFDPVCNGNLGYARSLSSFTSKLPDFAGRSVVIDGISRFVLRDGLIAEYSESVNGGVAMVQLGVAPERIAKVLNRWSQQLQDRDDTKAFLEAGKSTR